MSGIAPALAPPFHILFRDFWTRSDSSTTIPLLDDSSGNLNLDIIHTNGQNSMEDTYPTSQTLQHNHSSTNNDTVSQINNNADSGGTGMEDIMSRGDVFAGVIVFSVGMLVLIVAVTFYFANGRSLRTVRRNQSLANNSSVGSGRGASGGSEDVAGGVGVEDVDLEQNIQPRTTTTETGAGVAGEAGTLEKDLTFDPHSPSTARLIDHHLSSPSAFAFLRDSPSPSHSLHSHHSSNSLSLSPKSGQIGATTIDSKTGNDFDITNESTTLHMPVLTRTKARSSCKKKSEGMISLLTSAISLRGRGAAAKKKEKQLQQKAAAMEVARSASAIIIQVQEPSEPASAASSTPLDTHTHSSNTSNTHTSDPTSPLDQPETPEDAFSPIHPTSTDPSQMSILRLDTPSTIRSSSVVGLYGSAKSSPNGSMVDAASTRAIYCTSLKSAISFLPTGSTSTLGVFHTADVLGGGSTGVGAGQDIVIATAGLEPS